MRYRGEVGPRHDAPRYDDWERGRRRHGRPAPPWAHRTRPVRRRREPRGRPHPEAYRLRRRPGAWYSGPGEAHRYGHAPVPYGHEHTYDYHLGDRYGYGPDFYTGEARVRHWRRRERPMRRSPRR